MEEQAYLNKYKTQTDGLSCYTNRSVWLWDLDFETSWVEEASVFGNQMFKEDSWCDMAWAHYEQRDFVTII